jgi:hypothetical protein
MILRMVALATIMLSSGELPAQIVPLPSPVGQPWYSTMPSSYDFATEPLARPAGYNPSDVSLPLLEGTPNEPSARGGEIVPPPQSDVIQSIDPGVAGALPSEEAWTWQALPDGLVYRSYLAGFKEPRMHSLWAYDQDLGWVWDIALGGRVGLFRYGNCDDVQPEGWQLDLEGAAFPRLDPEEERDLVAADFRAGAPLTYGVGPYRIKLAYYHLSSHLGDEFLLKNPTATRFNYSRDVLVLGQAYYLNPDWRLYGEAGWAFYADVGGEWEFQLGLDYSPMVCNGFHGSPFAAFNGHLREEVDFGGNVVAQLGWQWRQGVSGHLLRVGLEYYNGKSDQFEFFDRYENKVGMALWYDY